MSIPVTQVVSESLNFIGMGAFALSGALMAVRKQMDVVGVVVLATITTLGGGIIRDVLIGELPPAALRNTWWLVVPLIATVLTFFFAPQVTRLRRAIVLFDAIGLGVFAATGAAIAMAHGLGMMPAALLGVVTGVGGGMLRDLLAGETPSVLRRDTQLYAIPAILGCGGLVISVRLGADPVWAQSVAAAFICGMRLLAILRRWRGPVPRPVIRPRRG